MALIIGLFIGGMIGFFTAALLTAGSEKNEN
ncbi:hypothetical protein CLTEP_02420 [Clostridium tepidiprofundi DSM 19306]|uniref:Uncharacterized protein n=1 Tax=Clostridium tepidiprofundi DSM 19306 TaxID=1121338 RepID=A0A151B7I0_9CLOT|nr:hypothetical protein CLTEP_02420 [Clostridium tepidiprofundi DSM 19306]